jgi:hypothetical protein
VLSQTSLPTVAALLGVLRRLEECIARLRVLRQCILSFRRTGLPRDGGALALQEASDAWAQARDVLVQSETKRRRKEPSSESTALRDDPFYADRQSWARALGFSHDIGEEWVALHAAGQGTSDQQPPRLSEGLIGTLRWPCPSAVAGDADIIVARSKGRIRQRRTRGARPYGWGQIFSAHPGFRLALRRPKNLGPYD